MDCKCQRVITVGKWQRPLRRHYDSIPTARWIHWMLPVRLGLLLASGRHFFFRISKMRMNCVAALLPLQWLAVISSAGSAGSAGSAQFHVRCPTVVQAAVDADVLICQGWRFRWWHHSRSRIEYDCSAGGRQESAGCEQHQLQQRIHPRLDR